MQQILIANSLTDGFVVFLTSARGWSSDVSNAAIADNETEAEALLKDATLAEAGNIVIDPYLVDVELKNGAPIPTEYREYIRVYGPSVGIPSGK